MRDDDDHMGSFSILHMLTLFDDDQEFKTDWRRQIDVSARVLKAVKFNCARDDHG